MKIAKLDHLVLTVKDLDATSKFYSDVLCMDKVIFGDDRVALKFGCQKINLHLYGAEFEPKAIKPTPGSADLCFITTLHVVKAMEHIMSFGVKIIEGPIERMGANGKLLSVYFRDPDDNLIELANEILD